VRREPGAKTLAVAHLSSLSKDLVEARFEFFGLGMKRAISSHWLSKLSMDLAYAEN
jgi:hypothetical protein